MQNEMDINAFAREAHAVAVKRGLYDAEVTDAEIVAGIHTAISAAYDEWKAGHPMEWHDCSLETEVTICETEDCAHHVKGTECEYCKKDAEPRGIAAELNEVVLRVLDAAAAWDVSIVGLALENLDFVNQESNVDSYDLPRLIVGLHELADMLLDNEYHRNTKVDAEYDIGSVMTTMIAIIYIWLRKRGINPERLLMEKHEYNKRMAHWLGGTSGEEV